MVPDPSSDSQKYLILDTETTGTIRAGHPPPRLVEVAWLICDALGTIEERDERVVRPDGFAIPVNAARVHGITTGYARQVGVPLREALAALGLATGESSLVVAHNLRFDRAVIAGECRRTGVLDPLATLPGICTMESTAAFCRIRRATGYKWPTLAELHQTLFGVPCERAHRAVGDAEACARCFFALKKAGFWEEMR